MANMFSSASLAGGFVEARALDCNGLEPPAWAVRMPGQVRPNRLTDRIEVETREGRSITLVSVRARDAAGYDARGFEWVTREVYRAVTNMIGPRTPVRFWNFIPRIHAPLGAGLDRYMVFNSGRHASYADRYGGEGPAGFGPQIATATGVGHRGRDLVVHCLASAQPGRAVENPRQIPAYLYSRRYGPCPPCFARATVVDLANGAGPTMLVGGTASVRGEGSMHLGDLDAQVKETLTNLCSVVVAEAREESDPLGRFTAVRVYYAREADGPRLRDELVARFPSAREFELMRADICRAELLVEIEGVAELRTRAGT